MFSGIPTAALPGGRSVVWASRVLVGAGVIAIVIAWFGASDTVLVDQQVDWAPLGLAGVAAITFGLLFSILVARAAVNLRLRRLGLVLRAPASGTLVDEVVPGASETLVAAANMARYHRATCPLTTGKPVGGGSRAVHEAAGRRACGVSAP